MREGRIALEKEVLVQCLRLVCQEAQLLMMRGWPSELRCKWCGAAVEVLTIDGKPVK